MGHIEVVQEVQKDLVLTKILFFAVAVITQFCLHNRENKIFSCDDYDDTEKD